MRRATKPVRKKKKSNSQAPSTASGLGHRDFIITIPSAPVKTPPPTFGVVFANSPSFQHYREIKSTKAFPVGTVIVRETRLEPDQQMPRTVLAMVKRAKGFNPKGGDWEFIEADGLNLKILKRQTTGSCLNCHKQAKTGDFVFRTAAEKQYQ